VKPIHDFDLTLVGIGPLKPSRESINGNRPRRRSDLLPAVLAVLDQGRLDRSHPRDAGDDRRNPPVVDHRQVMWNGQKDVAVLRPKGHRGAGHRPAWPQDVNRQAFFNLASALGRQPDALPKAGAGRGHALIDDFGVGKNESHVGFLERTFDRGELIRRPHVVLIGEHDDVSGAARHGPLEVGDDPHLLTVRHAVHREGRDGRELASERHTLIRRVVV